MILVINENVLSKKRKEKITMILSKIYVLYLKTKLRAVKFRLRLKKYDALGKKCFSLVQSHEKYAYLQHPAGSCWFIYMSV